MYAKRLLFPRVLSSCVAVFLAAVVPAPGEEARQETGDGPVMLFPIVKDGKWGYMDRTGKVVIEPQYDAAWDFSEGLACVAVGVLRGYIDRAGKVVIKPQFGWAGRFSHGFAPVFASTYKWGDNIQFYRAPGGELWAFIDRTGKVLKGFYKGYFCPADFQEGKSCFGRTICLGTDGKRIEHDAEELWQFSEGLAAARKGLKWGYMDHSMKWVIEPQFDAPGMFAEGLAPVARAEPPPPENKNEYRNWLKRRKLKWGYIDKNGKIVIAQQFENARPFSEGLAGVRVGGKWGYIDKTGAVVIEPQYDYGWRFSEGLARVLVGEKQGYINREGKLVIKPQFEPAWEFSKGLARVVIDGKEGYINTRGEYVWEPSK